MPTAVAAASLGVAAGVAAALLGLCLVVVWDVTQGIGLDGLDYSVRGTAFLSAALLVGWQARARHAGEVEADRWFAMSNDLVCIADLGGFFTRVNGAWTQLLGYSEDELLGRPYIDFVHPDDVAHTQKESASLVAEDYGIIGMENRYRAKDGKWHWLLWSARSDGKHIYAVAKDNTERRMLEEQLRAMATQDPLTGVANRRACDERLAEEVRRASRTRLPLTVAMFDLDGLKQINDANGHAAGDRLLTSAVEIWRHEIRDIDFLARVGGDEFCVLFPNTTSAVAKGVVQRMVQAGASGGVAFSAGISEWRFHDTSAEVLARADEALYEAKRTRGTYVMTQLAA